jgi:lipopolysaccharide export system protein LptA
MKRLVSLSLLLFSVTVASGVHAEKADSDKPTKVEADQMAYDDVKQINTFTGNVVVTQDPAGFQFATLTAAPGTLATFRQKRDGGADLWAEGQAERIEYDGKTEVVKLFSKAKMRRLDGPKPTEEVEGEFISYDSRAEFFAVNNTPTGESKPGGGRITAVIQPRAQAKDK